MKKMLVPLMALVLPSAFAENRVIQVKADVPGVRVMVVDKSNQVISAVRDNKYSLSNKNHQLCWVAFNLPFSLTNSVVEVFKSPKGATFSDPTGLTVISDDGKSHKVSVNLSNSTNGILERCWSFDKNDPKGKYSLAVKINGVSFSPQSFEIVQ